MKLADRFNGTGFSKWLNAKPGRIFRLSAGIVFLVVGLVFHSNPLGIASLIWSFFPITAGLFDVCYISAVLGGPFKGTAVRSCQAKL